VVEATAVAPPLVQLALATGCKVHIAHVSSAATLDVVRHAKRIGAPVTAETCPHYLFCTEDDLAHGRTLRRDQPADPQRADRDALWEALADGTLDVIATDHAPFSRPRRRRRSATCSRRRPATPASRRCCRC
jgi:allantoinase